MNRIDRIGKCIRADIHCASGRPNTYMHTSLYYYRSIWQRYLNKVFKKMRHNLCTFSQLGIAVGVEMIKFIATFRRQSQIVKCVLTAKYVTLRVKIPALNEHLGMGRLFSLGGLTTTGLGNRRLKPGSLRIW